MLPVKNFISLATIRNGSTLIPPGPAALAVAVALENTLDATDTACAHDDCLLRAGWYELEVGESRDAYRAVNWHLEQGDWSCGMDIEELFKSTEALVDRTFIS